jgi:hypothetical protein
MATRYSGTPCSMCSGVLLEAINTVQLVLDGTTHTIPVCPRHDTAIRRLFNQVLRKDQPALDTPVRVATTPPPPPGARPGRPRKNPDPHTSPAPHPVRPDRARDTARDTAPVTPPVQPAARQTPAPVTTPPPPNPAPVAAPAPDPVAVPKSVPAASPVRADRARETADPGVLFLQPGGAPVPATPTVVQPSYQPLDIDYGIITGTVDGINIDDVREWARETGIRLSMVGQIPDSIMTAYKRTLTPIALAAAAHNAQKKTKTRTTAPTTRRPIAARNTNDLDMGKVRAWANRSGLKVADRGRIPQNIIESYLRHRTDQD